MKYKPFKMASYGQTWHTAGAINMHSSNPEPFSWQELQGLTQIDWPQIIATAPLGYESAQGHMGVRSSLCEHQYSTLNPDQVVLTSGAQEGIFLVANSLLKKGDEVVTFTPCFEPLVSVAEALGARVKRLALNAAENWSIPWHQLEDVITPKTQLLIINFPHNPTGSTITTNELKRIITLCQNNDCWLFSDEVFRGLEHDTEALPAVAEHYSKGISMGVMSKALALPGIRLGWLVTRDQALVQSWLNIKAQISICQSSLDAHFTAQILPHRDVLLHRSNNIIQHNKNIVQYLLKDNDTFKANEAQASATMFIEFRAQGVNAELACQQIHQDHNIFLMPNPAFLTDHRGFRLTLGKNNAKSLYEAVFAAG